MLIPFLGLETRLMSQAPTDTGSSIDHGSGALSASAVAKPEKLHFTWDYLLIVADENPNATGK